jgi:glycosyltransferase involved in cell wall biosynthesis
MRIAFDHQAFCRRPYTGISRYYSQLITQLTMIPTVQARLFAPLHVNALLKTTPVPGWSGRGWLTHPRLLRPSIRAVSGWLARRALRHWQPDLVHETYYSTRASAPDGIPTVLTVFDCIHERYPHQFPWYDRLLTIKQRAIQRADHLICISEATRHDLLQFYPVSPEQITVIYLGVDQSTPPIKPSSHNAVSTASKLILFVGERGGYKNFVTLVQAFAQSSWLRHACQLVCFGGGPFTTAEHRLFKTLQLTPAQICQVHGSDQQLNDYYAQASVFVYPSYHEGFGLPLLEAMRCGCPVIASRSGAIPEVVADAACLFEPHDGEALMTLLETILRDTQLRQQLRQRGYQRMRAFHWRQCAQQTLNVYRHVIASLHS